METWHLARGFRYAGVHSGMRPDPERLDLALVVSDRPAARRGCSRRTASCAAPVRVCRERLPARDARGIVICSGNANACTGEQGLDDARRMADAAAAGARLPAGADAGLLDRRHRPAAADAADRGRHRAAGRAARRATRRPSTAPPTPS